MLGKRHKLSLFAAACGLAVMVSGCFTMRPQQHNKDVLVCQDQAPTGSHISRTTCYKRAQIEERGEQDREKMRRMQHQGAIKPENYSP